MLDDDDEAPTGRTPGKAEGEREIGTEAPIAPRTPGQAEGEREAEPPERAQ